MHILKQSILNNYPGRLTVFNMHILQQMAPFYISINASLKIVHFIT